MEDVLGEEFFPAVFAGVVSGAVLVVAFHVELKQSSITFFTQFRDEKIV